MIIAAAILLMIPSIAWAMGMGMGMGMDDIATRRGGAGTAAAGTFLLLQGTGFILLEGGGKIQCNAC